LQAVFRADNRLSREIRPISFAFDTTPDADGSATCEMGLTVVQVAIYGPREARRAGQAGAAGGGHMTEGEARVEVDASVAGFVAGERRKRSKGDK
jgi:exosome complex component RRP41